MQGLRSLHDSLPSPRSELRLRTRKMFWELTNKLNAEEFRISFRMNREDFRSFVRIVRPYLERNERMGALRNGVVEPEVRVVIVLRMLAGASDLHLVMLWGVARSTMYQILHDTINVLLDNLPFDNIPTTKEDFIRLAHGFRTSRRYQNPLPNCMGALDGIAIRNTKPRPSDCRDPASYFHRKGLYALPVQAICDATYKFTFASAKCAGPTHDSVAFNVSSYDEKLRKGQLPPGYWIAGDDAYVCDEYIITPLPASVCTPRSVEDAFNFFQSSHRMHIE